MTAPALKQLLPTPPTDAEKQSYVHRHQGILIVSSLLSLICLAMSQLHLVHLRPWLWALVPFLMFTLLYYVISLRVNVTSRDFDLDAHRRLVGEWQPDRYPSVDIFLPICGEALGVLMNTWRYVLRLSESYPGVVNVYVLDDGTEPWTKDLAAAHGFTHLVRPNRGWMKKAGNLRHGYHHSSGDFIVIFDADFAPRADFLAETLPYFAADQRLGIVQTPQFFRVDRRQGWMERGAGAVQELFYRAIQVSRDRYGGAICVGSCGVYRRAALDTIGGTSLIEHSEDVHTGFDLRRKGWGLRYLPIPLATGMCPPDADSFLTQQYRWCAGSMSLLGSRKFWTTRMPLTTRLCYVSGFSYYLHTAVATFVVPLIPITLLTVLPHQVQLRNYLLILPSTAYTLVIFPMWNNARFGPSALMAKLLYGWSHAFAVLDLARGRRMGWHTTGDRAKKPTERMWAALLAWGGVTGAAWLALAAYRMATMRAVNFGFLLGAGLLYVGVWGMAIVARGQVRETALVALPRPATLRVGTVRTSAAPRARPTPQPEMS